MKKIFIFFMIFISITTFCLNIAVSIPPQSFFVEKLGVDKSDILVMIRPGIDAHSFSPTPSQLMKLARCHVYFSIGLEFEHTLLKKVKNINKNIKVIKLDKVCEKILMENPFDMHEHDNHTSHSHGKYDPHVWTSIENVKK